MSEILLIYMKLGRKNERTIWILPDLDGGVKGAVHSIKVLQNWRLRRSRVVCKGVGNGEEHRGDGERQDGEPHSLGELLIDLWMVRRDLFLVECTAIFNHF